MLQGSFFRVVLAGLVVLGIAVVALPARADEAAGLQGDTLPAHAIWLDSLDLSKIEQGWKKPQACRSVEEHAIKIHGMTFAHGVGTHAESEMNVDLKGAATRFVSMVGVDDETGGKGLVRFEVLVDGKKVAESGDLRGNQPAKMLSADLRGAKWLTLSVIVPESNIDNCHADWAEARLELAADATDTPVSAASPNPPAPPIAREDSPAPAIHSPRITGSTPGRQTLFSCRPQARDR